MNKSFVLFILSIPLSIFSISCEKSNTQQPPPLRYWYYGQEYDSIAKNHAENRGDSVAMWPGAIHRDIISTPSDAAKIGWDLLKAIYKKDISKEHDGLFVTLVNDSFWHVEALGRCGWLNIYFRKKDGKVLGYVGGDLILIQDSRSH